MNLYILVEGRTEEVIYQQWLTYLLPHFRRVDNPSDVAVNNYYILVVLHK